MHDLIMRNRTRVWCSYSHSWKFLYFTQSHESFLIRYRVGSVSDTWINLICRGAAAIYSLGGKMAYLTLLTDVHPSRASSPMSRPKPLSLTPPNGALGLSIAQAFTVTWPDSRAAVTRWARLMSLVKTAALRPCRVSFALAITSASVSKGAMLYSR